MAFGSSPFRTAKFKLLTSWTAGALACARYSYGLCGRREPPEHENLKRSKLAGGLERSDNNYDERSFRAEAGSRAEARISGARKCEAVESYQRLGAKRQ